MVAGLKGLCVSAKSCATNSCFHPVIKKKKKRFLIVTVKYNACTFELLIAKVMWLQPYPDRLFFACPVGVWSLHNIQTDSAPEFLPTKFVLFLCIMLFAITV